MPARPRYGAGGLDAFVGQRNALDQPFDHQRLVDKALKAANDDRPFSHPDHLTDDVEPIARPDRIAKADFLQSAEADDLGPAQQVETLRVIAAHLRGRLAHQHARHQGDARKVAAYPKLVVGNVLIADADLVDLVLIDDRRQLLHLEALLVEPPYLVDVGDRVGQINGRQVENEIFSSHGGRVSLAIHYAFCGRTPPVASFPPLARFAGRSD